jgi:hydrophobic/amphiphilic exporter-1 (mainly G- bacteria), HAE1 family
MIASTCLVVVFVPSFYVVMQRIEEWRQRNRTPESAAPAEAKDAAGQSPA